VVISAVEQWSGSGNETAMAHDAGK
jgi:hypothetical protein